MKVSLVFYASPVVYRVPDAEDECVGCHDSFILLPAMMMILYVRM